MKTDDVRPLPSAHGLPPSVPLWALIPAYGLFPLLILAFIVAYTKPYPIWETWFFIDVWAQFAEGGDWLRSLFIERWGHIHALPNLINLLVGQVSCYDMLTDTIVTWCVAVAALVVIAKQLPRNLLIALGMASALFTTRLAEVWLNSWDLMWSLSLLQAALIGSCLARLTPRSMIVAMALGATSIVTAGQGVVIVAAGAVPLALHAWMHRRTLPYLMVWIVYIGACVAMLNTLVGHATPLAVLLQLDLQNVFGLLGLSLGEGASLATLLLLVAGIAMGYAVCRPGPHALSRSLWPADLFWLYMVALLIGFVTLLAVTRPGQFLSRYLMFLWIGPAAVVYLVHRVTEGRPKGRTLLSLLCAGWLAGNAWGSHAFRETVEGWEPMSKEVVALARNDPTAVRAGMLQGVASNDRLLVVRGLDTMQQLRVNIYCRR